MENLHFKIKLTLAKDYSFFGPGVFELLTLTEEYGSLNAAAKSMSLSYSKANKMINMSEKSLGFKLLERKIGGANGGGSALTPECIEFLKAYEKLESDTNEYANKLFEKYFKKYL